MFLIRQTFLISPDIFYGGLWWVTFAEVTAFSKREVGLHRETFPPD